MIVDVQESFDRDVEMGEIGPRGWNLSSGASAMGRLGYKLIVQTGEVNNPVDLSRVSDEYFLFACSFRPVATDVVCSVVCVSVCLRWSH